jgi:hypothetical protein
VCEGREAVKVVLAEPVIGECLAIAVELESVQFDGKNTLLPAELVVDILFAAVHLNVSLGYDVGGHFGKRRRGKSPAQKGVLKKRGRR